MAPTAGVFLVGARRRDGGRQGGARAHPLLVDGRHEEALGGLGAVLVHVLADVGGGGAAAPQAAIQLLVHRVAVLYGVRLHHQRIPR